MPLEPRITGSEAIDKGMEADVHIIATAALSWLPAELQPAQHNNGKGLACCRSPRRGDGSAIRTPTTMPAKIRARAGMRVHGVWRRCRGGRISRAALTGLAGVPRRSRARPSYSLLSGSAQGAVMMRLVALANPTVRARGGEGGGGF